MKPASISELIEVRGIISAISDALEEAAVDNISYVLDYAAKKISHVLSEEGGVQ